MDLIIHKTLLHLHAMVSGFSFRYFAGFTQTLSPSPSATLLSLFGYFDPHLQAFPAFSLEEAGGFTEKNGEDLPVPSLRSSCARGGEFRQIPLGIWLSEGRSSLGRRINLLHLLSE